MTEEITEGKIKLAIQRSYKNTEGEYEVDTIELQLWNTAEETKLARSVHKGDLIGAKGRIQTGNILIAEKITFLSSKRPDAKE